MQIQAIYYFNLTINITLIFYLRKNMSMLNILIGQQTSQKTKK